jgi:hypothetical protein
MTCKRCGTAISLTDRVPFVAEYCGSCIDSIVADWEVFVDEPIPYVLADVVEGVPPLFRKGRL